MQLRDILSLRAVVVAAVVVAIVTAGHVAAGLPASVDVVDQRCTDGEVSELTVDVSWRGNYVSVSRAHIRI